MTNNNRYYIYLSAFVLSALVGIALALVSFVYSVFFNFVVPPVLGPVLQGFAIVTEVVGAQLVFQKNNIACRVYAIIGALITVVAITIAAKEFKISLIGIKGYLIIGAIMVPLFSILSTAVSRVSYNNVRIVFGLFLMLCGIFVPAWIAANFVRDLL